jgi:hypothetical protein
LYLRDGISHGDVQCRLDLLLVEQRLVLGHQSERRSRNHSEYRHRNQQLNQTETRRAATSALQK